MPGAPSSFLLLLEMASNLIENIALHIARMSSLSSPGPRVSCHTCPNECLTAKVGDLGDGEDSASRLEANRYYSRLEATIFVMYYVHFWLFHNDHGTLHRSVYLSWSVFLRRLFVLRPFQLTDQGPDLRKPRMFDQSENNGM